MAETSASHLTYGAEFGDYVKLLKPRVMSLVVFTAAIGMLVAPGGINVVIGFAALVFIALGAGGSGAMNMWWDADIDGRMRRTVARPIPAGKVTPQEALTLGLWLSGIAVAMLFVTANPLSAALLAFTIFFYVVIYTIWLKRWTPQNIVIGGAAGAFPPMIGWAVVTGGVSIESILMFLVIFFWTPPHFWALALFVKDDYANADVPMLTVTHGTRATRRQVLIYTCVLAPVVIGLGFSSIGSPLYTAIAAFLMGRFLYGAWQIFNRDDARANADEFAVEKRVFKQSLYFLFILFAALFVGDGVQSVLPLPWPEVI